MLHTSVSPPLSPPQVSPGHVVGLVSQDVRRFKDALFYWHNVVVGPLEMMLVSATRAGEGGGGTHQRGGRGGMEGKGPQGLYCPRGMYRSNSPCFPSPLPDERRVGFLTSPWQAPAAALLPPPFLSCLRPADPHLPERSLSL